MTQARRYWCRSCRAFQECREHERDIVCNTCDSVIASFLEPGEEVRDGRVVKADER